MQHTHEDDAATDVPSDAAGWERRYATTGTHGHGHGHGVWSGRPNPALVDEATGIAPGTALDAGCGEGADAVWLAEQGWTVTAVDFSPTALARGAERARAAGVRVAWQQGDVSSWAPGATYDLVSAQFLHAGDRPQGGATYRNLAGLVAPGGILLLVNHDPSDLRTTVGRPNLPELFWSVDQLVALLADGEWDVEVAEARPRAQLDDEGRGTTVHDAVLRARRRPASSR